MKMHLCFTTIGSLWISSLMAVLAADTTNAPATRIGVYDSRAVAYAYFLSAPYQKDIQEKMSAARAAKQAGDSAKLKELDAVLKAKQAEGHRQVFSTAPPTAAMETIKDRLPQIEKQASVSVIVSKWDEATLQKYKDATRVDVTDKLVREFIQPDENQLKTISAIEKSEPMSLEKCDELIRKGEI